MVRTSLWLVALVAAGCSQSSRYGWYDVDMPKSPDYVELPAVKFNPQNPKVIEWHWVVCPDHGRVTSKTDLRSATHARWVHNDRYHNGGGRAQVVSAIGVGD